MTQLRYEQIPYHMLMQDRRWNADKPSAALDPYISTWLTTSPANYRPANFWKSFFETLEGNWKVVQSQAELMRINFEFEVSLSTPPPPPLSLSLYIYIYRVIAWCFRDRSCGIS